MTPEMLADFDSLLDGWFLSARNVSHPSDRQRLLDFFIRWYERGESPSPGEIEEFLHERGWESEDYSEVSEMPSDVRCIAQRLNRAATS